jgi:hypothetical protein
MDRKQSVIYIGARAVVSDGPSNRSAKLFRKKVRQEVPTFWIATGDLPETPANTFFQRVSRRAVLRSVIDTHYERRICCSV